MDDITVGGTSSTDAWIVNWSPLLTNLAAVTSLVLANLALANIDTLAHMVNHILWTEAAFSLVSNSE